jgi:hypothetical protein
MEAQQGFKHASKVSLLFIITPRKQATLAVKV